jgi:hypothetical protein
MTLLEEEKHFVVGPGMVAAGMTMMLVSLMNSNLGQTDPVITVQRQDFITANKYFYLRK